MIGVAISTHQRPDVLSRGLRQWAKYLPDILTVTHDVHGHGVAATKNRGIATLMDAGCQHLFLADDDLTPIKAEWWRPYVEDPALHLMHCWGARRLINDDGHYTTWTWPRGVLLYAHRTVIDTIGGMRTEFGRWGGEHAEWSQRIHNAGLTTHPFTDLTAAKHGVWHALDYTRQTPSTVTAQERADTAAHRRAVAEKYAGSTEYVDYR
ncbi:hypothetical protein [Mycobacterium gordonae]|uniref:Glycosyltransferase n=1 Tax=Mycobacterium gordonae TaxID=1778 RepID=A0A1X1WPH3_MYCGO|nr:hypothetical protein [Mycobacterium gordonae]MCV7004616.1 hypothetical protein [Mycobacterium gordonae]ODR16032.1 hypothetical protein BHQ23_31320 [Mycobacterium gordonae]ORV88535.1 hypothetical protein AWC08_22360 [Mycobacterium gordonae]